MQPNRREGYMAQRAKQLKSFALAEILRLAQQHQAINLATGAPDIPTPDLVKEAAVQAIRGDMNQYTNTWGMKELREAITQQYGRYYGLNIDPETELTITCGTTEAMFNVMAAILDPEDEIIVFEPFYDNYLVAAALNGATIRYVSLHSPDWCLDPQELAAAFNERTKAILLNTPNNPTGKVFNGEELRLIADLCHHWDVLCISDEIYEHLVFDGWHHISPLQLADMRERTIVISGMSKTYSVTGWRIGYVIAPPHMTHVIRKIHDCTTVGAAAPLQAAGIVAYTLPDNFYQILRQEYQQRRDYLARILEAQGFVCYKPQGAYYLMADISRFGFPNDRDFVMFLIKEIGIAAVPGSCFYATPSDSINLVRFCFARSEKTLSEAEVRLTRLTQHVN